MPILPNHKSISERLFCTKDVVNFLCDNTINHANEMILSTIDNESCTFKEMPKQPDKVDFIQAIVKEIDVHERISHRELCQRTYLTKVMKTIMCM